MEPFFSLYPGDMPEAIRLGSLKNDPDKNCFTLLAQCNQLKHVAFYSKRTLLTLGSTYNLWDTLKGNYSASKLDDLVGYGASSFQYEKVRLE